MTQKLKLLYVAGPGNVINTFECWRRGEDDPSQVSMTFSGQFYDLCTELDAEGYILASHPEKKFLQNGRFTLEHRPVRLQKRSGVLYYLGQILYQLSIVISALWYRADVVIQSDTDCFFVLALLPKLGIHVVPTLHCVLWAKYLPRSKVKKLLNRLNGWFFGSQCLAILSTSDDVNKQIGEITATRPLNIINFLSTYRRSEFKQIQPPNLQSSTFEVLFAGRIEPEKGVFDLLEIARRFRAAGREDIIFHVCGTGSKLDLLRQKVAQDGLEATFVIHGYCDKPTMRQMLSRSHVVVVPTKSSFVEGLNQVVIEGVLANRPVVTSSIWPALTYVREAVVEVPPDDVQAYGDAVLKLCDVPTFYEAKYRSCEKFQEQFYSSEKSWGTGLKAVLAPFYQAAPIEVATPDPGLS